MQRESESEENVSWNEIGEVLDAEMSTVEDIRADLARNEPSVKTIKKNGGLYERSFEFEGEIADVYKVKL